MVKGIFLGQVIRMQFEMRLRTTPSFAKQIWQLEGGEDVSITSEGELLQSKLSAKRHWKSDGNVTGAEKQRM